MKVAVEGCSHGELDAIYASVLRAEREQGFTVDVLLLCGDFQAIRNHADLHCLAVPAKYRQLGGFHRYYSGEKVAPILTLVVGGNHEASNYMWELYHGGWLAPNIYYLGGAGAVEVEGLTIAGASGIFKGPDYNKGRFERLPFDNSTMRSTYHTRKYDIERLKFLQKADVVMSHDWPNTIEQHGDTAKLIKRKPFFADEIKTGTLGSPPLLELLQTLKPPYWFSAHLHVKFAAVYDHDAAGSSRSAAKAVAAVQEQNPEAIDIDLDSDDDQADSKAKNSSTQVSAEQISDDVVDEEPVGGSCQHTQTTGENDGLIEATTTSSTYGQARNTTRFLALSKCTPKNDFLQYLDIPSSSDDAFARRKEAAAKSKRRAMPSLRFSKRWLAITRATHPELSLAVHQRSLPPPHDAGFQARITEQERWIDGKLAAMDGFERDEQSRLGADGAAAPDGGEAEASLHPPKHPLDIGRIQRFVRTAPAPFEPGGMMTGQPPWYTNPQTEALCHFLEVPNKINPRPPMAPMPPFPPGGGFMGPPSGGPFSGDPPHFHAGPGAFEGQQQLAPPIDQGGNKKRRRDSAAESDPNALEIDDDDFEDAQVGIDESVEADPAPFMIDEPAKRWAEGSG